MDLQAAIGIHQLKRIEENWIKRQHVWNYYQKAFKGLPIGLPTEPAAGTRHAYHLYTIMIDEDKCGISRDEFLERMNMAKIGTGVHYLSIPEHPYYQERFGWKPEHWPNAMRIGRQTVSLPISPKLTNKDIERIATTTRKFFDGAA
jgi:dTDP-4-amino-4,6-dideoxygalactose transaminase